MNFIYRYTPSLMSPETLEAIFVQRHRLVDDLIELIRESALTANKHYRLLVGMRGIGKTHTIAIIHHRLAKMDDLRDRLLIAWLQEEEWGVSSFLDLLLRILRSLAKAYSIEYEAKLKQQVEFLYELSFAEAEQEAGRILREFARGRTLLLLIENLDELFKGLGDIGQKQFRAYLQNYGFVTILATAQSLFDDISLQAHPFYGFFYPYALEKLTLNEACSLLSKIAELEDDFDLKEFIQSSVGRDRIAAIHHLAGGNHRVYVIFSQFLTRESLDNLVDPFMQTLDDLTPYYQARMQWLSVQQRKIVEVLCDHCHPITVKEIAKACFITHQTASSQLKDLREKGYVTSEIIGRESFYELQEPLMRICLEVKKHRGEPIKLFVDFLRVWYTQDELKQQLEKLLNAHDWYSRGRILTRLNYQQEALESYQKAIHLNLDTSDLWFRYGLAQHNLSYHEEALQSFNKTLEFNRDSYLPWLFKSVMLYNLSRFNEALTACDKAIELKNELSPNFLRALILLSMNLWDEGIIALSNALKHFRVTNQVDLDHTVFIVEKILHSTCDANLWKKRSCLIFSVYEKYNLIPELGRDLVESIPALLTDTVSDKAARSWLEIWEEVAGHKREFKIPLGLLNIAVEYKEKKGDRRVLLKLPIEERKLLEPLLRARVGTVMDSMEKAISPTLDE